MGFRSEDIARWESLQRLKRAMSRGTAKKREVKEKKKNERDDRTGNQRFSSRSPKMETTVV